MKCSRFAQLVILTQMVFVGYLVHRLQHDSMTCADPRDWIRPIMRFPNREKFLSEDFMVQRDVCNVMGYVLEVNPTWFREHNNSNHYDIDLPPPRDSKPAGRIEKLTDKVPGYHHVITFKWALLTRGGKYIPQTFQLPRQKQHFLAYQQSPENREKLWIQKNLNHRGNMVKDVQDIALDSESLVQEYISKPFTIDSRRFSIAVFVALSSTNPVRAYMMNSEVHLRFCAKGYYPMDFTDLSTYITDGIDEFGTLFVYEMESLKHLTLEKRYSHKSALGAHIRSKGKDPAIIYSQMYDAIRDVMNKSAGVFRQFKPDPKTKYFEMTRWDFVLDEDLNIYLIEVNWHPHMPAVDYNKGSKEWLYYNSHAMYNMHRVVGLHDVNSFQFSRCPYIVRDSDVQLHHPMCYSSCTSCDSKACYLCSQCLSTYQRNILKEVFLEYLNREDMRLVHTWDENDLLDYFNHTKDLGATPWKDNIALMSHWFRQKCTTEISWC